jgi:hypothetical protein
MIAAILRNASDCARLLAKKLAAPPGRVVVAPSTDNDGKVVLKVWVATGYSPAAVPNTFDGFPVKVERLPKFVAEG